MPGTAIKSETLEGKEIKRDEILDIFIPFVKGLTHSFVIAINSPWGTGKTTFVNQCMSELGEDYPSIYYNAWKADYSKDPFIDFCAEIIDMEKDESTTPSEEKQSLFNHAKRVGKNIWDKKGEISLSLISKIGTQELAEACGADEYAEEISEAVTGIITKQLEDYSERKSSTENFTSALEQFVEKITEGEAPLIIFVDELDRCRPSYAVELLERIKHLFGVENIVFVLSVDLRQLKYAVESIYGSGVQSEGYLRRFFDIVIDLPEFSKRAYCERLCQLYEIERTGIVTQLTAYSKKYDITLRQIDRIFTFFKIQLGDQNWKENYLINLESYTILKVLDPEKYDDFKNSKKVTAAFEDFIKDIYSDQPYYAAPLMSYMLTTMARTHSIDRDEKHNELLNDPFWAEAFNGYRGFGDGYLNALFNRLDFTADHARTGFDYW